MMLHSSLWLTGYKKEPCIKGTHPLLSPMCRYFLPDPTLSATRLPSNFFFCLLFCHDFNIPYEYMYRVQFLCWSRKRRKDNISASIEPPLSRSRLSEQGNHPALCPSQSHNHPALCPSQSYIIQPYAPANHICSALCPSQLHIIQPYAPTNHISNMGQLK